MGISLDNNQPTTTFDPAAGATGGGSDAAVGSLQGPVQRAINPNSVPASTEALQDRSVVENVSKLGVPSLSSPGSGGGGGYFASLGAKVAGVIVEFGADLRKQNQDRANQEIETVMANIKQQVDGMFNQSKLGLGMSVASGVFGMAMGVGFSAGGIKDLGSATAGLKTAQEVTSSKLTLGKEILQGIVNTMDGAKDSQLTAEGAKIKSDQGEQMASENSMESAKAFADSMQRMVEQALSTAKEMMQSANQSTARILA